MITNTAKKFIDQITFSDPKIFYSNEEVNRIQVDSFVSKIATIYEKVRNAIDYKEENLIRKAAIYRILQRRLLIKISAENLALALIKELIRAGYLENNLIPEAKGEEVNRIIEKYLAVYNLSGLHRMDEKGGKMFKWLLELCSCEIEECLMPPIADRALVEFMFKVMRKAVKIPDKDLTDKEKDLHIYLAVYKALVRSDEPMMDLKILKYYYPTWREAKPEEMMAVAKKINNLKKEIERRKSHYLSEKLFRLFKKYTFVFYILRDIILNNPEEAESIFNNKEELEFKIRQECDHAYKKTRAKLRRTIFRVIIYLFLTKMLLALVLEFPYDLYVAHHIAYIPLAINALFPPLLMMFLGIFIKIPSKKNTARVIAVAEEAISQESFTDLKTGWGGLVKRTNFALFIFYILYLALFFASFGALISILDSLQFNIFSKLIFLLFLSLVSFFGIKLRMKVKDMTVIDHKENVLVFLLNLFALPFLKAGHWLSVNLSKINVFMFVLDFIIEAPLKIFLEVIEDWIAFLREKKEEIYGRE